MATALGSFFSAGDEFRGRNLGEVERVVGEDDFEALNVNLAGAGKEAAAGKGNKGVFLVGERATSGEGDGVLVAMGGGVDDFGGGSGR